MKDHYDIVILPGDGVGPDVIRESLKVIDAISKKLSINFTIEEIPCGGAYYYKYEKEWPDGSFEKCKSADAILLGAVGAEVDGKTVFTKPGKPYAESELAGYAQVIGNRKKLDLYANVRPVKLYPGILQKVSGKFLKIWDSENIDYIVIRENTEDAYSSEGHDIKDNEGRLTGKVTDIKITEYATKKIVRFAYNLARTRNKKLKITCVEKSNIIAAHRYFRELFTQIGKTEFPDIKQDFAYFDAFCQWQLKNPENYDVVVAPNLVGDVISDNASITQGGLGMCAGANIGDNHAMFEPIHGSAPKYTNQNKVNPIACILATKMMFEYLAQKFNDTRLIKASYLTSEGVKKNLIENKVLTYDLIGEERASTTSQVGDRICEIINYLGD
jgi:3-isopropylmalate dehydrogenase